MTHCEYIKRISMHYGKYNKLYQPTPAKMNLGNSSSDELLISFFFCLPQKRGGWTVASWLENLLDLNDANNSVQFATVSVSEYI